jgi:hypothetical protein
MTAILEKAAALNGFVRLDMEGRTTRSARSILPPTAVRPLRRTLLGGHPVDASALRAGHRVSDRHAGAGQQYEGHLEPPAVAFPDKADVDRSY